MKRRIYRITDGKVIGGVCGGLGEYFDIDPTWIRILFVVTIILDGVSLLAYVIAWIVIPVRPFEIGSVSPDAPQGMASKPLSAGAGASTPNRGMGFWPGIILIVLGAIFIFHEVFWWINFAHIWPIFLIGLGVVLIYRAARPHSRDSETYVNTEDATEVSDGSR